MHTYTPTETEKRILAAAAEVFLEKGFRATTSQDIANRAGCNQALVYYYFRNKENLFLKVFSEKTELVFNSFADPLKRDLPFEDRLCTMIEAYFDFLQDHKQLPFFIVIELLQSEDNRQMLIDSFQHNSVRADVFFSFDRAVQAEVKSGTIRPIETFDLMMDIISLCVATFISQPILLHVLTSSGSPDDDALAHEYLIHRKQEITELILRGIRVSL